MRVDAQRPRSRRTARGDVSAQLHNKVAAVGATTTSGAATSATELEDRPKCGLPIKLARRSGGKAVERSERGALEAAEADT